MAVSTGNTRIGGSLDLTECWQERCAGYRSCVQYGWYVGLIGLLAPEFEIGSISRRRCGTHRHRVCEFARCREDVQYGRLDSPIETGRFGAFDAVPREEVRDGRVGHAIRR